MKIAIDQKVCTLVCLLTYQKCCRAVEGNQMVSTLEGKKPKYFGQNQTKMVIATEFSQRNYKMPYHVASLFVLPCTWKSKVYTEHFVSAQYVDSIIVQLLELSKRPPWHESSCIR